MDAFYYPIYPDETASILSPPFFNTYALLTSANAFLQPSFEDVLRIVDSSSRFSWYVNLQAIALAEERNALSFRQQYHKGIASALAYAFSLTLLSNTYLLLGMFEKAYYVLNKVSALCIKENRSRNKETRTTLVEIITSQTTTFSLLLLSQNNPESAIRKAKHASKTCILIAPSSALYQNNLIHILIYLAILYQMQNKHQHAQQTLQTIQQMLTNT